jgi:hypothetical protein
MLHLHFEENSRIIYDDCGSTLHVLRIQIIEHATTVDHCLILTARRGGDGCRSSEFMYPDWTQAKSIVNAMKKMTKIDRIIVDGYHYYILKCVEKYSVNRTSDWHEEWFDYLYLMQSSVFSPAVHFVHGYCSMIVYHYWPGSPLLSHTLCLPVRRFHSIDAVHKLDMPWRVWCRPFDLSIW